MRYLIVFGFMIVTPLIGGLYGALYDQITYGISPEFFKMRFDQIGYTVGPDARWMVSMIGFKNTWGIGFVLGAILGLVGLIHKTSREHIGFTSQSFLIPIAAAALFAFIGAVMPCSKTDPTLHNITDQAAFLCVERMNNYSRVGGIIGMIAGVLWHVYKSRAKKIVHLKS